MANSEQSVAINTCEVKVSPFWPEKPELWFCQLEGQFTLCGVTADLTKYCHVISQLDKKIALKVEDIITNPPDTHKYDKIKGELIKRLSPSQEQRTKQLLKHEDIGDRTPSQLLRHLRSLAGSTVPDSFLRTLWQDRLPASMQAILATQANLELDKIAELADRIEEAHPRARVIQATANRDYENSNAQIKSIAMSQEKQTQKRKTKSQSTGYGHKRSTLAEDLTVSTLDVGEYHKNVTAHAADDLALQLEANSSSEDESSVMADPSSSAKFVTRNRTSKRKLTVHEDTDDSDEEHDSPPPKKSQKPHNQDDMRIMLKNQQKMLKQQKVLLDELLERDRSKKECRDQRKIDQTGIKSLEDGKQLPSLQSSSTNVKNLTDAEPPITLNLKEVTPLSVKLPEVLSLPAFVPKQKGYKSRPQQPW